jgi:predicted RNase H-like nuclease (RuvC/YqgF family)
MKIIATFDWNNIKREIDFQGATLPDGRSIQGILDESEKLKKDISTLEDEKEKLKDDIESLEHEVKDKSSIFAKIIPWKSVRNILEIIMFIFGIFGIMGIILLFI